MKIADAIPCYREKIPCSAEIIPCSVAQGIRPKTGAISAAYAMTVGRNRLNSAKFPVLSLLNREIAGQTPETGSLETACTATALTIDIAVLFRISVVRNSRIFAGV